MKLQKKTILITGGTSGIGQELARQLLARGNTVIVTGRDPAKLAATERALPGVHALQSDVSDPAAIKALSERVLTQFPALDILVNNAGIMRNVNLNRSDELSDVTREIDINLSGPLRMVQQFLPHLLRREGAAIVNVSSGLCGYPESFMRAVLRCRRESTRPAAPRFRRRHTPLGVRPWAQALSPRADEQTRGVRPSWTSERLPSGRPQT